MSALDIACIGVGALGLIACLIAGVQLYRWEKFLTRCRITVHYKGRTAMTPRLIDLLTWALQLDNDAQVKGQVIYKLGGTTITLRKPLPRDHGKTTRRTIKGDPHT